MIVVLIQTLKVPKIVQIQTLKKINQVRGDKCRRRTGIRKCHILIPIAMRRLKGERKAIAESGVEQVLSLNLNLNPNPNPNLTAMKKQETERKEIITEALTQNLNPNQIRIRIQNLILDGILTI